MNDHVIRGCKHTLRSSEFENLLRSLDQDRERAGEKYEEIRRTLMRFFAWRKCFPAEDLADQTLDRVASRLESAQIRNLAAFIRGVAKIIVLEFRRRPQAVSIEDLRPGNYLKTEHAERCIITREEKQQQVEFLRKGIRELSPADRRLFFGYEYCARGREDKKQLAKQFGYTEQGLRTRAHRVRRKVKLSTLKYEVTFNRISRRPTAVNRLLSSHPAQCHLPQFAELHAGHRDMISSF